MIVLMKRNDSVWTDVPVQKPLVCNFKSITHIFIQMKCHVDDLHRLAEAIISKLYELQIFEFAQIR